MADPFGDAQVTRAGSYPPSWLDRFGAWVERLPIPGWSFYLALFVLGWAITTAFKWWDGRLAAGDFRTWPPPFVLWTVYLLAMTHYLDSVARARLIQFRPALNVSDDEVARLEYELTTTRQRPTVSFGLLWVGVCIVILALVLPTVRALNYPAWEIVVTTLAYFPGGAVMYQTLAQLLTVSRIHRLVHTVDLYQIEPYHAFAGLTARTAIGWSFLIYLTVLIVPESLTRTLIGYSFLIPLSLAVATFVWPLWGMHRLQVEEKRRLWAEANEHLKLAVDELHRDVRSGDLARMDALNKAILSLATERQILEDLPTWPWHPATVRGLVTALGLPIVLWLIQRVLEMLLL